MGKINTWEDFSKGHGSLFKSIIELNNYKVCVELGVAFGTTSKWFCEALKATGGHLYGFDIWDIHKPDIQKNDFLKIQNQNKQAEYEFHEEYKRTGSLELVENYLKDFSNYTMYQIDTKSKKFRKTLPNICPVIDFAFIDGDHSYNGVLNDFNIIYPLLSNVGTIAFHDTQKIDGCREFVLDLRTKFNDGTFDIVDFPHGNLDRRVGITLLVKRSFPVLKLEIDEICGSPSSPQEIINREQAWYLQEIKNAKK